ncbi:PREDICTED: zinc finger protein DZIP1L [Charadrius vociferus]|uniref:zinc finger protein DZIP1L n=1 Tax=Charadrius vociferus TaxID=50402 RepID=UPI000521C25C|nr:PREDICTED: zinc finger protein DZIP1L [Charadrius vociferus]
MAQLSIEYLLHCQDRLGTSLAGHVQGLQAAHAELERTQQQAAEQATQLREAKEESRRWKKLVATQYLLLQAGPDAYCKCHLCDKAFVNNSFLQAHVQRRHTEATKVEQMEDEVEELKAKLRETQQRLEAEREAEKLRREQEAERARQREEEGRRDLERWKEEERTKLREEVDSLRQLFLAAFKDVASRNSAMEGKLQELRAREMAVSNLGSLRDDDTEEGWGRTPSWAEHERMAVQLTKEKTLRAAPSQEVVMDRVHQRSTWLGEQPKVLKSREKEIKLLSASKPEVTQEVTKVVAGEESSDREEAALGGKRRLLEALQRNPNLLKQFRPILEEVLEEKLENMGVKRVAKGISTRTYKSLQALVRLQQQQKAEKFPGLLHLRDELVQAVMRKVRRCKKPSGAVPQQLSIIPGENLVSDGLRGSPRGSPQDYQEPPEDSLGRPVDLQSQQSPWRTCPTMEVSPIASFQSPGSSDAVLGGKQPTMSPMKLSPQQEPAFSAVVRGDETVSNGSDQNSLEEMAGSGTATSTMVRLLERHLDAVAQRRLGGAKLFPALSSASPKTSQPTKKLQFAGDSGDLDTSSLEDLDEPPALVAADARKTTLVPRALRSRAARGHMVVTGK